MNKYNLILGSQSPRRKSLLEQAGYTFKVEIKPIDESYGKEIDPKDVAEYLANKKSAVFLNELKENDLIITADSVVVLNGRIYEKPVDRNDAINILTELSGHTHIVYTGVCLLSKHKKVSFTDETKVCFAILSRSEIEDYIDKFKPFDKAGSYGIQDWLGLCKVTKIEGSYANVMGLPVHRIYKELSQF